MKLSALGETRNGYLTSIKPRTLGELIPRHQERDEIKLPIFRPGPTPRHDPEPPIEREPDPDSIEVRFGIDLPGHLRTVARREVRRRANSVSRPPRLGLERTAVIETAASAVVALAVMPQRDHRVPELLEAFQAATDRLGLPRYIDGGLVPGRLVVRNPVRGRVWRVNRRNLELLETENSSLEI